MSFLGDNFDLDKDTVVHAHTLFSDGALAYELCKKKHNPYIVAVRDTDINIFWKYFPHLRQYGRSILEGACSVVFLSPAYRDKTAILLPPCLRQTVLDKSHVIPNGIDSYWFLNGPEKNKNISEEIRVLFVGKFIKRKNIKNLIRSCLFLRKLGYDVSLRLVGATESFHFNYQRKKPWIKVVPFSKSKVELLNHFRWADVFSMPSFTETFGLVYAEALSQGTPVVYSSGEGFDGWVEEGVCGHAVSPRDPEDIARGILRMKNNYNLNKCVESVTPFSWEKIADDYLSIYKEALKRNSK